MKSSIVGIVFGVFILFCCWILMLTIEHPGNQSPCYASTDYSRCLENNDAQKAYSLAYTKYLNEQYNYEFIAYIGLFIAAISAISLIYFKYVAVAYAKRTYANKKLKAENELLKDRELYDKGILTKEEFEKKVAEGKKHII